LPLMIQSCTSLPICTFSSSTSLFIRTFTR